MISIDKEIQGLKGRQGCVYRLKKDEEESAMDAEITVNEVVLSVSGVQHTDEWC